MSSAKLTLQSTLPLSHSTSKAAIPNIGFGVYKSSKDICKTSVLHAIKSGYRQIDTAQMYENETEVGEAIAACGLPREELYIVTKLSSLGGSPEETYEKCVESVKKLTLGKEGYVDLFLIHSPSMGPKGRKEAWQALEKLKDAGLTKDIGVSNFGTKHLDQLSEYAKYTPVVNQIELHPWCQQPTVTSYCESKNILLQAYAPLVRGRKMNDPTLTSIATAHNVSPAQILIRWCLQRGFIPLPKSDTPARIESNRDVYDFELTAEEMDKLNALGKGLEDGQGAICPYVVHCE